MREREYDYRRPGDRGQRSYDDRYQADDGPFAGKGPRGYQRSDERIFEEVCERLTTHAGIDATSVDVDVLRGIVTLTGTVDDRRQKRLAEETIESVSGVRDIENQLRLSSIGQETERREERTEERPAAIGTQEPDRDKDRQKEGTAIGAAGTQPDADRDADRDKDRYAWARSEERAEQRKEERPQEPAERREEQPAERRELAPATIARSPDLETVAERDRSEDKTAQFPTATAQQADSSPVTPTLERSDEKTGQVEKAASDSKATDKPEDRQPVGVMEDERERERRIESESKPTESAVESRPTESAAPSPAPTETASGAPSTPAAIGATDGSGDGRSGSAEDSPRAETREIRLTTGAPVYTTEGEKIGEVAEASGEYFIVHKGLIFASELYIPADSILRSDENGVQINIPKDQVGNYKERPSRATVS